MDGRWGTKQELLGDSNCRWCCCKPRISRKHKELTENEHSTTRIGTDQIPTKEAGFRSICKETFELPSTVQTGTFESACRSSVQHPQTVPSAWPFQAPVIYRWGGEPADIHNEWTQPNSFPWCEIVLSACDKGSLKTKGPLCIFNQAPSLPEREEISLSLWPSQFIP